MESLDDSVSRLCVEFGFPLDYREPRIPRGGAIVFPFTVGDDEPVTSKPFVELIWKLVVKFDERALVALMTFGRQVRSVKGSFLESVETRDDVLRWFEPPWTGDVSSDLGTFMYAQWVVIGGSRKWALYELEAEVYFLWVREPDAEILSLHDPESLQFSLEMGHKDFVEKILAR